MEHIDEECVRIREDRFYMQVYILLDSIDSSPDVFPDDKTF